jgi:hypothetical protein
MLIKTVKTKLVVLLRWTLRPDSLASGLGFPSADALRNSPTERSEPLCAERRLPVELIVWDRPLGADPLDVKEFARGVTSLPIAGLQGRAESADTWSPVL